MILSLIGSVWLYKLALEIGPLLRIGIKWNERTLAYDISIGWCKKDVTPLLTHWSYVFLALTHRFVHFILASVPVSQSRRIRDNRYMYMNRQVPHIQSMTIQSTARMYICKTKLILLIRILKKIYVAALIRLRHRTTYLRGMVLCKLDVRFFRSLSLGSRSFKRCSNILNINVLHLEYSR